MSNYTLKVPYNQTTNDYNNVRCSQTLFLKAQATMTVLYYQTLLVLLRVWTAHVSKQLHENEFTFHAKHTKKYFQKSQATIRQNFSKYNVKTFIHRCSEANGLSVELMIHQS